ncbi:MAG: hypothetical protein OEV40_15085 [Acidimicrobiia bacterium]|nr:hypothetical protein [Acidimicrobiia bacterium]
MTAPAPPPMAPPTVAKPAADEVRTTAGRSLAIAPGFGRFTFERGRGWRRLLATALGFPGPGSVPVGLDIAPGPVEVWTRRIGGRRVRTRLELVDDRLVETIGPVVIEFATTLDVPGPDRSVGVTARRWGLRVAGRTVPLPPSYRPRISIDTCRQGSGLRVYVRIADHRGRLIAGYRGLLHPAGRPSEDLR